MLASLLAAAVLATAHPAPDTLRPRAAAPDPGVQVEVDSSRKEFVVTVGPFDLPDMPPMDDHAMMDHGATHDTPMHRFTWPIDGWFRGFRIELEDSAGNPVSRHVMHHMIMVNFDRRQLLYSAAERLMGSGTETSDISVPKTIGVPLEPGTRLGMYVAWHNDTGKDLRGVYLKIKMLWIPKNQVPQPRNALPIYMDVNLTVGASNTFDVPPGKSSQSYEFTLPVGGRLLGVGGHLHDYGSSVRLEDVKTGKVLALVKAKRTPEGKVLGMERKLFAVAGEGLRLRANHPYRVVGEYDNTTGELRVRGGMAHLAGLFVPDDLEEWPAIDPRDATFQRDLASLEGRGEDHAEGHGGMDHSGHGEADHQTHGSRDEGGNGRAEHDGHGEGGDHPDDHDAHSESHEDHDDHE